MICEPWGRKESEVGRYAKELKDKVVARLLPPESASVESVAAEVGISAATLERWRAAALSEPTQQRSWTAAARLEAVLSTAALDEASKSAWCRSHGLYPQELVQWRQAALQALQQPGSATLSANTRQERHRIKELERELRRKERALAETAALLVLSKKLEAIFPRGEDE